MQTEAAEKEQLPHWRLQIADAFAALAIAETYGDDGAFLTAADRAEKAAKLFRAGHAARVAAMSAKAEV